MDDDLVRTLESTVEVEQATYRQRASSTRIGTIAGLAALLAAAGLSGCSRTRQEPSTGKDAGGGQLRDAGPSTRTDAGGVRSHDAGSSSDAAATTHADAGSSVVHDAGTSGAECTVASDCVLIAQGCCAACEPKKSDVLAVPRDQSDAARKRVCPSQPSCGPCPPIVPEPTRPILRPDCVAQKCVVIDVRESALSACDSASDCTLFANGCCSGCGPDPARYLALHATTYPYEDLCVADCAPCMDPLQPEAFCADDHHCAVHEVARVNGQVSSTCFSRWQNLDHAYDTGATGCDCYSPGAGLCIADSTGRNVALDCPERGPWKAVNDGPCANSK